MARHIMHKGRTLATFHRFLVVINHGDGRLCDVMTVEDETAADAEAMVQGYYPKAPLTVALVAENEEEEAK